METHREISVEENQTIRFKKWVDDKTGLPTREWSAILPINGLEIEYSFEEAVFKQWNSEEIKVDWELIKQIANTILPQIDTLLQKSNRLLIALHQEIFGNEYIEKQGYFEFSAIEIAKADCAPFYYYEFDLRFWLESHSGFLMDPYFSYFVRFRNITQTMLTVVSVRRE
jgi:hypothetical protein